jgi:hypothetical protein
MRSREKPCCGSCAHLDTTTTHTVGGIEAARLYTKAEQDGGICTRASTPFRQPLGSVCACYDGPALPRWSRWLGSYTELRARRSLAAESLDSLSLARDDAAVLRCALSGAWRRAVDARARSHELWAFLTPALDGGLLPDAPVWRDRVSNVTTSISRILMSLGDLARFKALADTGITNLGIHMPERDTGRVCQACGEDMNSREYHDDTNDTLVCRACAEKAGLLGKTP